MNSVSKKPLSEDVLEKMDAYWRAANYLSVGQIYLFDNPLLEAIRDKLLDHKAYVSKYGDDMPNVRDWKWTVTA